MPVEFAELTEFLNGLRVMFDDDAVYDMIEEAADVIGMTALEELGDIYPPDPPDGTEPSPLRTPKQRRWFWWSMTRIARGEPVSESLRGWKASYKKINGHKTLVISDKSGYKRTGTLVRSINYEVNKKGDGVIVAIGPTMAREVGGGDVADYASYVIGLPPPEGYQAKIHQDRWVPLETAIANMSDKLMEVFQDELIEIVRKRLKGHGYSWTGSSVR